jgi:DNA-binding IclR family transcriptional regulator
VTQHDRRRIERALAFLSREVAQTKPDNTVVLSVLSGTSLVAITKVSGESAVTALTGLVRLFL